MPDGDIIDRKVLRGWRTPMRMLVGVAPSAEVSTAAVKALVHSLKENGGMPALAELHEILELRLANRVDAHSAFTRIEALERAYGHTRHAKLAAKAAKRLMIRERARPPCSQFVAGGAQRAVLPRPARSPLLRSNRA